MRLVHRVTKNSIKRSDRYLGINRWGKLFLKYESQEGAEIRVLRFNIQINQSNHVSENRVLATSFYLSFIVIFIIITIKQMKKENVLGIHTQYHTLVHACTLTDMYHQKHI